MTASEATMHRWLHSSLADLQRWFPLSPRLSSRRPFISKMTFLVISHPVTLGDHQPNQDVLKSLFQVYRTWKPTVVKFSLNWNLLRLTASH